MDAKEETNRNSLFKGTGKIVFGDRFVGRMNELRRIDETVVSNHSNLAVMGMPRIGKSSLVWQSLMTRKEALIEENMLPIFIDCGVAKSSNDFFDTIVKSTIEEVEEIDFSEDLMSSVSSILEKYSRVYFEALTPIEKNNALNKFFSKLYKKTKLAIVFILDEFDHTQKIFSIGDFQTLRELSYHPEPDITYVTTSRKSISEIETVDGKISNLHGIFSSMPLGMFSTKDVDTYWKRVDKFYLVPENAKSDIINYVGPHPYFMDLCCIEYLRYGDLGSLKESSFEVKMSGEFNQLINILHQDDLLNTAIQLVVGPSIESDMMKVDRLINFGIIKKIRVQDKAKIVNTTYLADEAQMTSFVLFGDYFTKLFYNQYLLNTPYWPLWGKTENKLREVINTLFRMHYGTDWQIKIEQDNANDSIWMDNWGKMKERYIDNQYVSSKTSTPVDFAETGQIYYQFIVKYWNWFGQIFQATEEDRRNALIHGWQPDAFKCWKARFQKLIEVRRPIAHNNRGIINSDDIKVAKQYCELILKAITDWENNGKEINFSICLSGCKENRGRSKESERAPQESVKYQGHIKKRLSRN